MKKLKQLSQAGFTLVELLVIAPIVVLAIGAFITVVISMTGEVLTSRASNSLAYNVQDAMNRIEQDIKLSTTFLGENTFTPQNGQGSNNGTAKFTNLSGANGPVLILNMLATSGNPLDTNSTIVYRAGQPATCAGNGTDVYTNYSRNTPMTYNVVYFVDTSGTLWRRTIVPSDFTTASARCGAGVPWQQASCRPSDVGSISGCTTEDVRLVDGVGASGFVVQYFTAADSQTANTAAASDPSVSNRNTALQAIPTAGISISASQSVAGRAVERSATLRATRLDTNASSIAVPRTPGAPTAPVIAAKNLAPTSIVFTWAAANEAAGYTIEYRINGGSWTNGFTNQNTRTYTVTSATHTNTVEARVKSINTAGVESGWTTASATVPLWVPMELQNGWQNYGYTHSSAAYTKTSTGLVVIKGLVKGGSGVIATLPPGYRVGTNEQLLYPNASNTALGRVDINNNGTVSMSFGNNAWFSLDGIAYMPTGTLPTGASGQTSFTNLTGFMNGWTSYPAPWAPPAYYHDSAGRVITRGLIRSGTTAGNTPMVSMPSGLMPSEYNHIVEINTDAIGHISFQPTNNSIVAKGGGNGFTGLNAIYYPTGRTTGSNCSTQWCNLSLANGWVWYNTPYTSPQYTKSPDGMVMLKGLVRSGPGGSTIATLPAAFCPREQMLLTAVTADTWGRLDVMPGSAGGCAVNATVVNNVWVSLDNIKFIADYQ
jgi:Tfp pilus assembly protein PilE